MILLQHSHCFNTDMEYPSCTQSGSVLDDDTLHLVSIQLVAIAKADLTLSFLFLPWVTFLRFSSPFLFVNKFNKALAEVIEVKDLDIQNLYRPVDLSIHTIPILQRII